MRKLAFALLTLLTLAACNDEERAHETKLKQMEHQHQRNLHAQTLQAEMQTASIQIAAGERTAEKRFNVVERVLKFVAAGVVALGGLAGCVWLLNMRNKHLRDVQIAVHTEETRRHEQFVNLVLNPDNGLSDDLREKAIYAAAQSIRGALPFYEGPDTA